MDINTSAATGMMGKALDSQTLGAQVVTSTLNKMNTDPVSGKLNSDFDFQNKVLAGQGLGKNLNSSI